MVMRCSRSFHKTGREYDFQLCLSTEQGEQRTRVSVSANSAECRGKISIIRSNVAVNMKRKVAPTSLSLSLLNGI